MGSNKGWVTFCMDTEKMRQKRVWKLNSILDKTGTGGERNNQFLNNSRLTKIRLRIRLGNMKNGSGSRLWKHF